MKTIEEEFPTEEHIAFDGQLADCYTRLRARAVEMERALNEIVELHKFCADEKPNSFCSKGCADIARDPSARP